MPADRDLYRLFERSPVGMYRSSEDGRLHYVNPALVRMLGYDTVEEVLALDLDRDIYIDRSERSQLIAAYHAKGVIDGVRVRWKRRDGSPIVAQIWGHIVEDPARVGPSFDASVVDITAHELQRDDLERTARTLELVVKQMPALYWLVDRDLRILRTGGAIQEVLGYPPDRWVGKTLYDVRAIEPGSRDSIETHKRALAGDIVNYTSIYRGKTLNNTIAPYHRDGQLVGAIGTAIDVTAMHALEQRMVDAQRAESLGVLAGGLAHDFNNLLVAILGNADLGLRDTPPGAPGRAALDNIRHASLRAAELTDQLLSYAGRGGVSSARVPARPLVDELLRITAPTLPPNVTIEVEIAPDLAMRGDAAQIRQVFLNLIANARDALGHDGGSIAISARLVAHCGDVDRDDVLPVGTTGTYLLVEVADTGPGIARDTRRRIFEPFFTTKSSGHGLGLAAVLGIVRAHSGGLRLITTPGEGARFQVMWPAATTPAPMPAVVPANARTVLVIDDEDMVRDVVARMIEDLGYAAVTAPDGMTGIELAEQRTVDAVLVDLTMPRMNGADVVAALRAKRPELPIVLCTGYDRDRKGPVEATAYLPKPFRIELLEATLAKILRER